MTWWMWLVLVLASLALLAALGWRLFTRVRALLRAVKDASGRVATTQREAEAALEEWLVQRAAEDEAYLASIDPRQDVR